MAVVVVGGLGPELVGCEVESPGLEEAESPVKDGVRFGNG